MRPLAVDLLVRVGLVEVKLLDARARRRHQVALSAPHDLLEHLRLDLQVPGVIVLARFEDRARSRDGVATALDLDPIERRLVRLPIVWVDRVGDQVAGPKVFHHEGTGPERLQVERRVAGIGADVLL
jgi:hypothetical protein